MRIFPIKGQILQVKEMKKCPHKVTALAMLMASMRISITQQRYSHLSKWTPGLFLFPDGQSHFSPYMGFEPDGHCDLNY